jgi:hypothetical protein
MTRVLRKAGLRLSLLADRKCGRFAILIVPTIISMMLLYVILQGLQGDLNSIVMTKVLSTLSSMTMGTLVGV